MHLSHFAKLLTEDLQVAKFYETWSSSSTALRAVVILFAKECTLKAGDPPLGDFLTTFKQANIIYHIMRNYYISLFIYAGVL